MNLACKGYVGQGSRSLIAELNYVVVHRKSYVCKWELLISVHTRT